MLAKIDEAAKECGDNGYVTRQALQKQLPTSAWLPLLDENSKLS